MILVLVTRGKDEKVDFVSVYTFVDIESANEFIKNTNTGRIKYWTYAEIVSAGEEVELMRPDD